MQWYLPSKRAAFGVEGEEFSDSYPRRKIARSRSPSTLFRAGFRLPSLSTPATKTCPFTPANKNRSPGAPNRLGPGALRSPG